MLVRPPLAALAGDFVRAEHLNDSGQLQLLRKEDQLADGTVTCVMTNRKVAWQHAARQQNAKK